MKRVNTEALRVVVLFFLFGLFWVVFTTGYFSSLVDSYYEILQVEMYKGFLFIILSSVIIYLIVQREIKKKQLFEQVLEIEKNKYKILFESANDAIIILNEKNQIIDCNEKSLDFFQCRRRDLLNKKPSDLSPQYQYDEISSGELMEYKMDIARNGIPLKFDWLHTSLDKSTSFFTEVSLNKIEFNGINNVFAVIRDITEEKKILQRIKESEEKYRLLIENSPTVFWIRNRQMKTLYISSNVAKVIGYTPQDIYNEEYNVWLNRIHPKDKINVITTFDSVFTNNNSADVTYRIRDKNQKWVWVNTTIAKQDNYKGESVAYGVSTDITEKKHAQQKLLHAMINAEERERSRVAKELHDGVSPILSALNLFVESLRNSGNEKIRKELSVKIKETIKEAIDSINEISNNISPHILQNFGLLEAVNAFANKMTDYSKVRIKVTSNIKDKFSEIIETAFYRITTELINNTLKYANAKNITIDYTVNPDTYIMKYEDDGTGFNVEKVMDQKKGMGLFNIKNRINSLQGYLDMRNKPSGGFFVEIFIPR